MADNGHRNGNSSVTWRYVGVTAVILVIGMIGGSWASITQRQANIEETQRLEIERLEAEIESLQRDYRGLQVDFINVNNRATNLEREISNLRQKDEDINRLLDQVFPRRIPFGNSE